jgi:hypothetical protein
VNALVLLVALQTRPPLLEASLIARDGCAQPKEAAAALEAVRKQAPAEAALIDRARSAIARGPCKDVLDAAAALMGRWADQNPGDGAVQHQAVALLSSLADRGEEHHVPGRPYLEMATRRARAVVAKWPRDAQSHAHLGAMLGILQAGSLEALQVFGKCLELDPQHKLCRQSFHELAEYYEAPRCDRDGMRKVTLVAGKKMIADGKSGLSGVVLLVARDGKPHLHLYLDDVARSHVVDAGAQTQTLDIVVDGKTVEQISIAGAAMKELVELTSGQIESVCRNVTRRALPENLKKYR